ncbi:DUF397 domain-containing protein [Streptomyces sp. NPDC007100]|uniref:DUF397 domain-containing protein n=1 Tax=Streptomyces sp. NPDC007100 TaxID=3155602 RepID=UPI0033DC66B4
MNAIEPVWIKSSYSGGDGDDCVEIAASPTTVRLRDSKRPHWPELSIASASWSAFVSFAAGQTV